MDNIVHLLQFEADDAHRIAREYIGAMRLTKSQVLSVLDSLGDDYDISQAADDILTLLTENDVVRVTRVEDMVNAIHEIYEKAATRAIVASLRHASKEMEL
jgi:hypothetical protein